MRVAAMFLSAVLGGCIGTSIGLMVKLLLLAACATPPPDDTAARMAALQAQADRVDLALTRAERDRERLTIHDWVTVNTEQPDGPRQACIDCGRTR